MQPAATTGRETHHALFEFDGASCYCLGGVFIAHRVCALVVDVDPE
jgi:hypothetical protein